MNTTGTCPGDEEWNDVGKASSVLQIVTSMYGPTIAAAALFAGRSAFDFMDSTGKLAQLESQWKSLNCTLNDVKKAGDDHELARYFPEFLRKCNEDLAQIERTTMYLRAECNHRSRVRNFLSFLGDFATRVRSSYDQLCRMDENIKSSSIRASRLARDNVPPPTREEQLAEIERMRRANETSARWTPWLRLPVIGSTVRSDQTELVDMEAGFATVVVTGSLSASVASADAQLSLQGSHAAQADGPSVPLPPSTDDDAPAAEGDVADARPSSVASGITLDSAVVHAVFHYQAGDIGGSASSKVDLVNAQEQLTVLESAMEGDGEVL
ncbi:hypothetical protein EXIGLDRAFT_756900 [Exidia glandulosa HHB12029]|uniref:Uncharacterized protein n=1 Tax=Exidia glandulosa HHB12029 TaxID=1314781 RepID=A0A165Z5D6_EXIGL|nr:hypothetical protein EXIGLDRAFT_756900 [Exidia glandulosa HHB12029]